MAAAGSGDLLYSFEDYGLDTNRRELYHATSLLSVEPKVFDLLVYVIQNRERVVSKDDLVAAVWNGRIVSESALTTCINAARTAIGDSGEAQRLIKTFPRKGVRFIGIVKEEANPAAMAPTGATPPLSRPSPARPSKPSIAVLPFTNMSGDHNQYFFADGMTEDLITALSRVRELLVVPRTATSGYKGHETPIGKVASELGVRHILTGSVRVAGTKVRVTAQLIDCITGGHVWAENFDGKLDDIFAVQDEITRNIVLALQIKLTSGETARLWEGQTKNLRAWEKLVLARDKFFRFDVADNRDAQRLLEESLQIDPNYTGAMLQLGMTYYWEGRYITSADKEICAQRIEQQVDNILRVDPDMGSASMLKGCIALMRGRHEEAIRFCQRAVEFAPGDSWNVAILATAYIYNGDGYKAVTLLKTAMRLSPYIPPWHTYYFVLANLWNGDLVTARETAETYLRQEPNEPYGYVNLALVYGFDGQEANASRVISELRNRSLELGIRDILFSQCYRQQEKLDRVVEVLRRAGLPE